MPKISAVRPIGRQYPSMGLMGYGKLSLVYSL